MKHLRDFKKYYFHHQNAFFLKDHTKLYEKVDM